MPINCAGGQCIPSSRPVSATAYIALSIQTNTAICINQCETVEFYVKFNT